MLTLQSIQPDMGAYPHSGTCQISLPGAGLHPTLCWIRGNGSPVQVKLEDYLGCLTQGRGFKVKCHAGAHRRSTRSFYIWEVWDNNSFVSWTVTNTYTVQQFVGSHLFFHCPKAAVGQGKRHRGFLEGRDWHQRFAGQWLNLNH